MIEVFAVERLYFPCHIRFDNVDAYVIWYTDDRDGFVRSRDGRLLVLKTRELLTHHAASANIQLDMADRYETNLCRIQNWCRHPQSQDVVCSEFLDVWNFFDDLADIHSFPERNYSRISRDAEACYDKLFWGSNLPSMTPPGERFDPIWSETELFAMRTVFEAGMSVLERELAEAQIAPA